MEKISHQNGDFPNFVGGRAFCDHSREVYLKKYCLPG